MINRFHQGEKIFLDNLYIVYTYYESPYDSIDDENFTIQSGGWRKMHPFYSEVDKNNITHLFQNNTFQRVINDYDDRNISNKDVIFRI